MNLLLWHRDAILDGWIFLYMYIGEAALAQRMRSSSR